MITLDSGGVRIDETDWASANPRRDGIEVFFRNGPRVYLDREFLTHALDLIEATDARAMVTGSEGVKP